MTFIKDNVVYIRKRCIEKQYLYIATALDR